MVDIFHCGPAALISALFDELKIGQTIDEMVHWDRRAFGKRFKVPMVLELAGFSPDIYLDVKDRNDYFA